MHIEIRLEIWGIKINRKNSRLDYREASKHVIKHCKKSFQNLIFLLFGFQSC